MKVTVTTTIQGPDLSSGLNIMNRATISKMEKVAVDGIKASIAVGRSPVKGYGSFEPYISQRGGPKSGKGKGYPLDIQYKYPNKKETPVNLSLKGRMLKALKAEYNSEKNTFQIMIDPKHDQGLSQKKAETHNNGTQIDKVPQRKFLPGNKEEFIEPIQQDLLEIVEERVLDILNKK